MLRACWLPRGARSPPACQNANAADGIEALLSSSRTTKPEPGHKIYPYLLRGMAITRRPGLGQDITYIPWSAVSFTSLSCSMGDRRVLSCALSITMEAAFCVRDPGGCLARHGKPEIFNTDQGSQFTGSAFTGLLASNGIAISMDGKGACGQRVRRAVVAQRQIRGGLSAGLRSVGEARNSIGRYLDFYNGRRPDQSLTTPHQIKLLQPDAIPLGA